MSPEVDDDVYSGISENLSDTFSVKAQKDHYTSVRIVVDWNRVYLKRTLEVPNPFLTILSAARVKGIPVGGPESNLFSSLYTVPTKVGSIPVLRPSFIWMGVVILPAARVGMVAPRGNIRGGPGGIFLVSVL